MTRKLTILILALGLALAACGDDDVDVATPAAGGNDDLPVAVCLGEYEDRLVEYEGLTLDQAQALADEDGLTVREVGRDGECFPMTMDLRTDRVNIEIFDDVVIAATIF